MGYQPTRPTFKLIFKDDEFDGLGVRTTSPSLGALQETMRLAGSASDSQDYSQLDKMIDLFAELLLEWNVEDDAGAPVPPTVPGLQAQPAPFVMSLIKAWGEQMRQSVQVPDPLDETSTGGSLSGVPSLPMDPSSTSRAS
jgi:hypothetical protein